MRLKLEIDTGIRQSVVVYIEIVSGNEEKRIFMR